MICEWCEKERPDVVKVEYLGVTWWECPECEQRYRDNPDSVWDDLADWVVENAGNLQ